MADKKNMTKKQPPKKSAKRDKDTYIKNNANQKDYSLLLNKILICLYAIIMILVVNTTLLVMNGVSTTKKVNEEKSEDIEYDVSMFKSITADTLEDAVADDKAKIVYIGRSTCGFCVQFLPVLQKAQAEYGYETLYLDITTVKTQEQQDKILAFDNDSEFLKKNFGGTPMVLIMKSGELVGTWMGYAEYDSYAKWLEENGFAK